MYPIEFDTQEWSETMEKAMEKKQNAANKGNGKKGGKARARAKAKHKPKARAKLEKGKASPTRSPSTSKAAQETSNTSAEAAWKSTKIGKMQKRKNTPRNGPEPMKKKNMKTSPMYKVGKKICKKHRKVGQSRREDRNGTRR